MAYSDTIRKVKFLSKYSILTQPQHFHEFFTQHFFDNFSRAIKVVNSSKGQNHNIFTSFSLKKIDNFLGKSKLDFWTKNEDFEQCGTEIDFCSKFHTAASVICRQHCHLDKAKILCVAPLYLQVKPLKD